MSEEGRTGRVFHVFFYLILASCFSILLEHCVLWVCFTYNRVEIIMCDFDFCMFSGI